MNSPESKLAEQPLAAKLEGLKVDIDGSLKTSKGQKGRPVDLYANYFPLELPADFRLYEYELEYSSPPHNRFGTRALLDAHESLLGKERDFWKENLILKKKLPDLITKVVCQETDGNTLTISIKRVAEHFPNSHVTWKILEWVINSMMWALGLEKIEGRLYFQDHEVRLPEHGLKIIPMIHHSVESHDCGLLLNWDVTNLVIRDKTVLDLMFEVEVGQREGRVNNVMTEDNVKEFQEKLLGLKVVSRCSRSQLRRGGNHFYTVFEVSFGVTPLSEVSFSNDDSTTYKEYYRQKFNLDITEDTQFLICCRAEDRIIGCGCYDYEYLIPEFCYLVGLGELSKNSYVMKDVTVHLMPNAESTANKLTEIVKRINSYPEVQEKLQNWGIRLSEDFLPVQGHQLPKEKVFQAENVEVKYDGDSDDWTSGIRGKVMSKCVSLVEWTVVFNQANENVVKNFVDNLRKAASEMGMEIDMPDLIQVQKDSTDGFISSLQSHVRDDTQLVMCVLTEENRAMMDPVKLYLSCEKPVLSQLVPFDTIKDADILESVAVNIARQLNVKLGGEIWTVPIPITGLMVIGMDVGPVTEHGSVTGFVASLNQNITSFYSRVTMYKGLENCAKDAFTQYQEINGSLPQTVLVYRDGTEDGVCEACFGTSTLDEIQKKEIPAIENAFKSVGGDQYSPDYGFIIVNQECNIRLFSKQTTEFVNPSPGTVVDSDITFKDGGMSKRTGRSEQPLPPKLGCNFYLVSQSEKEGTATPTHYSMMHDNTSLTPDDIQGLTYKLCHLYYNQTGTIPVPAPCRYAQHLARFVAESIHKEPSLKMADKLYYL